MKLLGVYIFAQLSSYYKFRCILIEVENCPMFGVKKNGSASNAFELPIALFRLDRFLHICLLEAKNLNKRKIILMNQDIAEGNWTELKGKIKSKWAKLTDHDIDEVKGNLEQIAGKIQKVYGYAKEKAEQEYKDFQANLKNKKT